MRDTGYERSIPFVLTVVLAALLVPPQIGTAQAQRVIGHATALRTSVSTLLGTTTTALAATGSLVNEHDVRGAAALTGQVPGVAAAEVLRASTISSNSGWSLGDRVWSDASLAGLAVTVAGARISAAFATAQAVAPLGAVATGRSSVEGLAVNGVPIAVTGTENEAIMLPGLRIVVNEVQRTASSITVTALHITSLDGAVDVVVASATAGLSF